MRMNIKGGMIIGGLAAEIEVLVPTEVEDNISLDEYMEDNGLDRMDLHYDCGDDSRYYGFRINDILVSDINGDWLDKIKVKAAEFEDLTGLKAKLIGCQDVT